MFECNNNLRTKLKYVYNNFNINENNYISIFEYENIGNTYFDVIFNNKGVKKFIGRYNKINDGINVKYNNGLILVCNETFIREEGKKYITDVYTLYDILDDTCYVISSKEALELFDNSIINSYLNDPDKLIIRSDVEKKHRLNFK